MDRRLKSRCLGLLELTAYDKDSFSLIDQLWSGDELCSKVLGLRIPEVQLMHRSAIEFIRSPEIQTELEKILGTHSAPPVVGLLNSVLAQVKLCDSIKDEGNLVSRLLSRAMRIALKECYGSHTDSVWPILNKFDTEMATLCTRSRISSLPWTIIHHEVLDPPTWLWIARLPDFMSVAAYSGFLPFVRMYLPTNIYTSQRGSSACAQLLASALIHVNRLQGMEPHPALLPKLIDLPLRTGANPNESSRIEFWDPTERRMYPDTRTHGRLLSTVVAGTLDLRLRH